MFVQMIMRCDVKTEGRDIEYKKEGLTLGKCHIIFQLFKFVLNVLPDSKTAIILL